MAAVESAKVGAVDRLGFTLFLAVAMHALVILGVTFGTDKPPAIHNTLEITLAQYQSDKAPEQADFIAQHNQVGSGESEQKSQPTTTERAPFQSNESRPVAPQKQSMQLQEVAEVASPVPPAEQPQAQPAPEPETQKSRAREVLVTRAETPEERVSKVEREQQQTAPPATGAATSLVARSLEIAALEAKLDLINREIANKPRVRTLYSASTRESFDAAYLDAWRRKVERIGNLNYPEEARRRKLYGSLRMLVVLKPDGSLQRVEVLKSSGHKVLDDAALRIVRLASPFSPFSPELRKHADIVEIIRTWRFEPTSFDVNG